MKKLLLLAGFIFLLAGCSTLKTPEIKGVVVDAETGKPIADARIYATWKRTYSGPGGPSGGGISKELRLQTDKQGRFIVPSHLLINPVPYPFGQGGSFYLVFYDHGYIYKLFNAHADEQVFQKELNDAASGKDVVIAVSKVKTPKDWKWNWDVVCSIETEQYINEEQKSLIANFANKKWDLASDMIILNTLHSLKQYGLERDKMKKMIGIYPSKSEYFKERLQYLERY